MKTTLAIIFAIAVLFACSGDKDSIETRISGYYRIVSFTADTNVDMNRDGVKTDDLLKEIGGLHHTIDDQYVSFYDFESISSYMEARPIDYQNNESKLISFNIPDQYIEEISSGEFYLSMYLPTLSNYSYNLDDTSSDIELINNNVDENGRATHLQIQNDGSLKLELTKKVFDFVDADWVEVHATVIFKKVKV